MRGTKGRVCVTSGAPLPEYVVLKGHPECFAPFMRVAFLLGRNVAVCLFRLGGDVEAEQGQRALPRGGGSTFLPMSFHPKGVSQGSGWRQRGAWGQEEGCLCEEGWQNWSGSTTRLSPKLLQGSGGKLASSDPP